MKKTEESIVNAFMEMEMCEVPDDCEVLDAETNEIDALMCEMCDESLMENIFNVEKYIKVLSQVQRVRLLGMHVLNMGELDGDPEKIKQVKDNIELSRRESIFLKSVFCENPAKDRCTCKSTF